MSQPEGDSGIPEHLRQCVVSVLEQIGGHKRGGGNYGGGEPLTIDVEPGITI